MIKRLLILSLIINVFTSTNAQIIVSNDTTVCGNYVDILQAVGADQDSINGDDDYSGLIQIGFPFTFYGNTYTSLVVCDNGYITFDAYQANNTSSGYTITSPVPLPFLLPIANATGPNNAIMAPWHDVLLASPFGGGNGSVFISKIGVSPNRKFLATWCSAAMFSCTDSLNTFQIVLHEGSNKIETFLDTKRSCSWNNGAAVHGLVDATSTNFNIVIDPVLSQPRNFPLLWTASQEGWEFLPNGPTSYTINQIPFSVIFAGVATWTDVNGNILGVGASLPVNLTASSVIYAGISGECSGGSLTDSIVIDIHPCFEIILSSIEASCIGNDGSILCAPDIVLPSWDVELQDISGNPIQFTSNITSSSYTFNNLFPGVYIAKIIDNLGNSSQDTIFVDQAFNPITIHSNPVGVSCYNGNDGQARIWPSGGLAPYIFLIDGDTILNAFPLDSLVEDLSGGSYIVSVIDDNNCMVRDTVIVTSPLYPLQALASSKIVVCHGDSSGIVLGSAAGGTPGYSYSWYESFNPISFSDNDTAFGLVAGSYYLEVMDANGCDTFSSVNVIEPQVALQGSPQIFGVQCKGDSTGMLVGDAGGGWGPYIYCWLDAQGDTLQSSMNHITTRDTLFNLSTGSYQLHIYDSKGCFIDYVLNVPEADIALSIDSLNVVESIACYGDSVGKAIMYVSGGQPNYYYLWDNGETTLVADALTSGYHTVSLTDDWGCEVLDSIDIPENTLIESDLVVNTTVSCYGVSDGIAVISTQGGASFTYTYFWSQGQNTIGVNLDTAVGLLHGSYYVTTRDVLGCEVVDSVYISEPAPLSMEASELDWVDCYNEATGEAFATAIGGTESYLFSWDNGTWIGDTINTLTPGLHTVVVTDSRGCTSSDTVETHNPDSLYINIDDTQTVLSYCVGVNTASLSADAVGGTPGYTYEWNDNPTLPQTTTTATALLAGTYTITVTDSKGCIASDTRDIDTVTNTMNTSITSLYQYASGSLDSNEVSCFGYNDGAAEVVAWGAHAPYSYQWYGPNALNSSTSLIDNLYAGTYSVTVRDTNNCMVNSSITLIEPSALTFNTSTATSESCLGACDGTILVDSIAGGVFPFYSLLTDNQTGSITSHSMMNDFILDVCSGDYKIALLDVNDCSATVIPGGLDQQLVGYDTYTEAMINILTAEDTICHASSAGSLEVLSPNINPGYTYSWSNGDVALSIDSLSAGVYILYADYNNTSGCTTTDTLDIFEHSEITNTVTIVDVDCYGENTGSISATAGGTISPYTYTWSTGQSGLNTVASNLSAGSYSLTVSDGNNCENVFAYIVDEPLGLDLSVTQNNYTLTALVSAGTSPYTYEWFEQSLPTQVLSSNITYTVSSNGTYYVVVTDANDCKLTSDAISYGETSAVIESALLALNIYPNPFNKETTVDFGRDITHATIRLVDVFGKHIEEYTITNTNKHIITRNNKASGIYFLEIEVEKQEIVMFKLMIE